MNRPKNELSALNHRFIGIKNDALKRDLLFEITFEEFEELSFKNCFYCGDEPSNIAKHGSSITKYNGLDQIVPCGGYTTNNVVPCCIMCNHLKGDRPLNEFLNWIKTVVEYNGWNNE